MAFLYDEVAQKRKTADFRNLCTDRFSKTVILEQEKYISEHPEIAELLKLFFSEVKAEKQKNIQLMTNPCFQIRNHIKKIMNTRITPGQKGNRTFCYDSSHLDSDLINLLEQYYCGGDPSLSTDYSLHTQSSSFISILTSQTTVATPEPSPIPEPTLEEIFRGQISHLVDKAVYGQITDHELNYDTAHVEIVKAVENAMESTVVLIREDIEEMIFSMLQKFDLCIMEKERIAAEVLWEKRMRKKQKRLIRRQMNFIGTDPESSIYDLSSHSSNFKPPLQPCECSPQYKYNRYAKDKYGIYKPRAEQFSKGNTTSTPDISMTDTQEN